MVSSRASLVIRACRSLSGLCIRIRRNPCPIRPPFCTWPMEESDVVLTADGRADISSQVRLRKPGPCRGARRRSSDMIKSDSGAVTQFPGELANAISLFLQDSESQSPVEPISLNSQLICPGPQPIFQAEVPGIHASFFRGR